MNKEFIPYEEALALKLLGFDELCLAKYNSQMDLVTSGCYSDSHPIYLAITQSDICEAHILAPLYQQAFRWFREKYNLYHVIDRDTTEEGNFDCQILDKIGFIYGENNKDGHQILGDIRRTNSYEEAELACLRKLIEIIKQK